MKLYLVDALVTTPTSAEQLARWAGSKAEVAAIRKEFKEKGAKNSQITTTEIEVPTNKQGLLAFLNEGKY